MSNLNIEKARFIPYTREDIVRLLLDELTGDAREQLAQLSRLLVNIYHVQFHRTLETLKTCYTPINPDSDTMTVFPDSDAAMAEKEATLFATLTELLNQANFEPVTQTDIDIAMEDASLFNIKLDIDFEDFERILFFRRGESVKEETVVSWFGLRKKDVTFINYDRVVMIVKFKPQDYFDAQERDDLFFKPGSIIVKYFRNIPRNDIEMLFPNPEVLMRPIDKLIIGVPAVIGGIVMLATNLGTTLLLFGTLIAFWVGMHHEPVELNQTNLLAFAVGFTTLGAFLWKQFNNFKNRKIRFMKTLADNLYFKNLDNNLGVFHRLIDTAEEEECKEAILAYAFLIKANEALSADELDTRIEQWFRDTQQHDMDFEVDDALQKLVRLNLVTVDEQTYQAVPLPAAIQTLTQVWQDAIQTTS